MIINFKVLVATKNKIKKKYQSSYFVYEHTQPLHSCPGLKHSTVCCEVKEEAHAHTQTQPPTAICALTAFVTVAFAAEGSALHKTM